MDTQIEANRTNGNQQPWQVAVAQYRTPSLGHSLWQVANTFGPFFLILVLMYFSLSFSYWLTLALAPLAAGFHLRLFIIFHDCGHGSFFKSQRANAILGMICGFMCFTPYYHWRHSHAVHHATTGNLTQRMMGEVLPLTLDKYTKTNGDVLTLTVSEYRQLSGWEKLTYRSYRYLLLFVIFLPLFIFVVMHRFANPKSSKLERQSVIWTNLVLLSVVLISTFTVGIGPLVLILLPVITMSSSIGVWLFYIQHQFEETYWQPAAVWNFQDAALQGSSYYKLPVVLQWFTGNIGFHHIHHLSPRIPNYNLQKCYRANQLFQEAKALTLWSGLRSVFFRLWDEDQQKMVGFGHLKELQPKEK